MGFDFPREPFDRYTIGPNGAQSSRQGTLPTAGGRLFAINETRLAETLAALSLATDLADGVPLETGLRGCLIAVGIGRQMGISGEQLSDVYYASLLMGLGCTSTEHGAKAPPVYEELEARQAIAGVDLTRPGEALGAVFSRVGRGGGAVGRAHAISSLMIKAFREGPDFGQRVGASFCEVGRLLAAHLGLRSSVVASIGSIFERWDGSGMPEGLAGEQIPVAARIAMTSHLIQVLVIRGEQANIEQMLRRRSQGWVDPGVAETFLLHLNEQLESAEADSVWDAVLEAEPEPRPWVPSARLDQIARAFAEFADLKTPCMVGHSGAVAALAQRAARDLGLAERDVDALSRAALLHDLGRVSVPGGIWAKRSRLSASEWERVRLYPHYTERILTRSPALAAISRLAASHHERLDGSGYHRGVPGTLLGPSERLLAAADCYHSMTEERPYRSALAPEHAARELATEADAGRLDRTAVAAILKAAGQRQPHMRVAWPAGLSDREVDVLRLVGKGNSNKEVAKALFISPETVNNHLRHIYEKAGVSTRAGAAVFAMEKDLIHAQV